MIYSSITLSNSKLNLIQCKMCVTINLSSCDQSKILEWVTCKIYSKWICCSPYPKPPNFVILKKLPIPNTIPPHCDSLSLSMIWTSILRWNIPIRSEIPFGIQKLDEKHWSFQISGNKYAERTFMNIILKVLSITKSTYFSIIYD